MEKSILVVFIALSILLTGCKSVTNTSVNNSYYEIQEIKLEIEGERGELIPAILTLPVSKESLSLVLMAHGHGESKEENGGFTTIANALGERGIAVIRMDFPGCGESKESFKANTIINMVDDVVSCKDYVTKNYNIDNNSIGLFGYSMGGRVIQTILNLNYIDNVRGMVLLAPALDRATAVKALGGSEAWAKLKKIAIEKGSVEFTTIFGVKQDLSIAWFEQLEIENPLEDVKPFDGIATVLYSEDDTVVNPLTSKSEAIKLGANLVLVDGASHFYGFYSDRIDIIQAVVDSTVDTFTKAFNN